MNLITPLQCITTHSAKLSPLLFLTLLLTHCGPANPIGGPLDPNTPHDIAYVKITASLDGVVKSTAEWSDLDGTGPNAPNVSACKLTLKSGFQYSICLDTITLLNDLTLTAEQQKSAVNPLHPEAPWGPSKSYTALMARNDDNFLVYKEEPMIAYYDDTSNHTFDIAGFTGGAPLDRVVGRNMIWEISGNGTRTITLSIVRRHDRTAGGLQKGDKMKSRPSDGIVDLVLPIEVTIQ